MTVENVSRRHFLGGMFSILVSASLALAELLQSGVRIPPAVLAVGDKSGTVEVDPDLEGDLRLVDAETGEGVDVTADLPTIDAYRSRLTAWKESLADLSARRRASYLDLSSETPLNELIFAELRRRRVLG